MSSQVKLKVGADLINFRYDAPKDLVSLKNAISAVTGISAERMKIMVKGKLLKDDSSLYNMRLKNDDVLNVIGSKDNLPKPPPEQATFLEDLSFAELAHVSPSGLINLGNTCYMNSSLQVLRQIPELRDALNGLPPSSPASGSGQSKLTKAMSQLFAIMDTSSEAIPPLVFLQTLRQIAPQFAEISNHGAYAQQDADEMWTQAISSLHGALRIGSDELNETSFVDRYLAADVTHTLVCDESPEETPTVRVDRVLKLDCNISISTNFLMAGIKDSLDQKIEKNSPSLGRMAVYTQRSRLSRLPSNLTVHMVRFFWRPDISKKAKIMRKVKFPLELDVMDLVTDDLRVQMLPINSAVKKILQDRDDRARGRRSRRPNAASSSDAVSGMADVGSEEQIRQDEKIALEKLIMDQGISRDAGSSYSGLYELCGIVSHKGASADSGHYIGWTRIRNEQGVRDEDEWHKFDDDKVSVVSREKILALEGGGEDSVAYILLYRSPTV